jgi:hypothetical protein
LMTIDFTSAFGVGGNVDVSKVAIDSQGDTYATGDFTGKVSFDPGSTGGNVLDAGAKLTAFVAKYSPTNTLLWVKQFSVDTTVPNGSSVGAGVAVDKNTGSVYVTGHFAGKVDFDPGGNTLSLTSAGDTDIFVVKLTANGDLDSGLAKRYGGVSTDIGSNIALDASGANVNTVELSRAAEVL